MESPNTPRLFVLLLGCALAASAHAESTDRQETSTVEHRDSPGQPPATVGAWIRDAAPRRIDADTIFDYMNGAGELYLAYRFHHLEVYSYRADGQPEILVELYRMAGPDEAWGLQSEDWTGEAVALGEVTSDSRRALYGGGLLRLACGPLYARVMAYEETPASRQAVMDLGAALATGCEPARPPALASGLPSTATAGGTDYQLRDDRVRFFRSHLVLNSVYFLASQDLLGLDQTVDGVIAEYRPEGGDHTTRLHAVALEYPAPTSAQAVARRFRIAYLETPDPDDAAAGQLAVEDGWVAWHRDGSRLVLIFQAPNQGAAADMAARLITAQPTEGTTP
jgi:hypothetical protein